ncbi:hypothetical protein [Shewanella halifaxensis]|uniref:hypothetical protein n=1 Tax=Shewanella halifaxensis TaxID=271098 RepID=UPI000D599C97|nr:hypothetical protein [Shewanella halifaxensis]
MRLEDLLDMDMGKVSDWLVENAHKYTLHQNRLRLILLKILKYMARKFYVGMAVIGLLIT